MRLYISEQLMQLAGAVAAGAGLGIVYDVFRVLRRNTKSRVFSVIWDILFWMCVIVGLFTLGMGLGKGSLQVSMASFAVLGFAVYMLLPSKAVLFVLSRAAELLRRVLSPVKKIMLKLHGIAKNAIIKAKLRYKLKKQDKPAPNKGETDENQSFADTGYHNSACSDLRRDASELRSRTSP